MKRLIAFCLALACAGFMASALFAAPGLSAPKLNPQMSSINYALDWSAVGEISGGASASASYKMNATIGQMAANTSSTSTNFGLCTGFECVLNTLSLYLPLIRR
jgi:nitric oxide reductase large subunit